MTQRTFLVSLLAMLFLIAAPSLYAQGACGWKGPKASCGKASDGKSCCAEMNDGKPCYGDAKGGKPCCANDKECKDCCKGNCPTHGHGGADKDDYSHGSLYLDYAKDLELNEKQVTKLNDLRVDAQKKTATLWEQKHSSYAELTRLSHEAKVNRGKIFALTKKIGELKGEMLKVQIAAMLDAKEVLTPAQQEKFSSMFKKDK
jgi:Spy/CpxP family protein refolding chaperone